MDSNGTGGRAPQDVEGAVTYAPTGGTLREPPLAPPGYHRIDERVAIGRGGPRFQQAVDALFDWQVQRGAGVRVTTDGPPTLGRRATLGVGVGPARLSAPVIVVGIAGAGTAADTGRTTQAGRHDQTDPGDGPGRTTHPETSGRGPTQSPGPTEVRPDEGHPARRGFAYGTCPGHPESGEEAFLVERDVDDVVWLRIVAFSRPATWLARLGGPVGRAAKAVITRRYLRALGPRMTS